MNVLPGSRVIAREDVSRERCRGMDQSEATRSRSSVGSGVAWAMPFQKASILTSTLNEDLVPKEIRCQKCPVVGRTSSGNPCTHG